MTERSLAEEAMAEADYEPTSAIARKKTRFVTPVLIRLPKEEADALDWWIHKTGNRVSNRMRGIAIHAAFDGFIKSIIADKKESGE